MGCLIDGHFKRNSKVTFVEVIVSGGNGDIVSPRRCYLGVRGITVRRVAVAEITGRVCCRIGRVGYVFKMSIIPR